MCACACASVQPGTEEDVPAVPGACAAAGAAAGSAGSARCRRAAGRAGAACEGLRSPGAAPWGGSWGPAWARSCPAPSEPAPRTAGRTPAPSAPSGCRTPGWGRSLGRQLGSAEKCEQQEQLAGRGFSQDCTRLIQPPCKTKLPGCECL